MGKVKKVVKVVLILLAISIVIILTREFILWNDGKLDKSNPVSREEIIKLLDTGATYPNYYYSSDVNTGEIKTEYYIKDNKVTTYTDSQLHSEANYNTGETTVYWNINNEVKESNYINSEISKYNQHGFDYSIIADYDTFKEEYEYLGEKEIEERTVILIQMNPPKDNAFLTGGTRFTIDKETGLILGRRDFSKILFITIYDNDTNRNVKFNVEN